MKKRNALLLSLLLLLFARCGYFEDLVTGVEKTPALFSGVVQDSLTGKPVAGAQVTVAAESAVTDAQGVFNLTGLYTGEKAMTVSATGYPAITRTVAVTTGLPASVTVRLIRLNHAPQIVRVLYPGPNATNVPLLLQFKCLLRDSDYTAPFSKERLSISLYFGTTSSPLLLCSGYVDTLNLRCDSLTVVAPDTLLRSLQPNQRYYWRLFVTDIFGAMDSLPLDSFVTRPLVSPCSTGMTLVEKESLSFCMDTLEVTNGLYDNYDLSHIRALQSNFNKTPATNVDIGNAEDSFCVRKGKTLCTIDEWKAATGGYAGWDYPYGPAYIAGKCNTDAMDPYHKDLADMVGTNPNCRSIYGVYDLSGNAAEWVKYKDTKLGSEQDFYYYAGGSFLSGGKSGVDSTTTHIRPDIGFRCCHKVR